MKKEPIMVGRGENMASCECCLDCYIIDICKARCKFDCENCPQNEENKRER